jgi:DNA mismatch repair protein MutL
MPRIQQLSSHVVNKIAAGEVIERPASVVKELLENSVDALATRIDVDIEEGGTELIRIADNGEGIHPDDFLLAVTSHATSKISSADDLFRVNTLGFRGEALASISEVSRFRIRSRTADGLGIGDDAGAGVELEVNGGTPGPLRPCGCPVGTIIEVRQLFHNTPVRRKFLKTQSTEFSHISEQFARIALANPRLHLVLRHNGKTIYEMPPAENLLDRITKFYGGDDSEPLIAVESEHAGIRLWGYVGHPSQSKATRKSQYLFLNGRWIQDRSLQHALGEAYRGLLMVGRYPICFLFLEIPADQVDVNVHPTKAEVRFRDSQQIYRQLLAALRTKFLGMNLDSQLRVKAGAGGGLASGGSGLKFEPFRPAVPFEPRRDPQPVLPAWTGNPRFPFNPTPVIPAPGHEAAPWDSGSSSTATRDPTWPAAERLPNGDPSAESVPGASETSEQVPSETAFESANGSTTTDETAAAPAADNASVAPPETDVRAMQIHDSYIVLETPDGIQVVDQHALHERILYEHLRHRVLAGGAESQRLLLPVTMELPPTEAALIGEHAEMLGKVGLGVESFGGNTVLVSGYPAMLRRIDPTQIVRDVAEQLTATGSDPSRRDLLDSLLHMMSCKAAIKAGQRLTAEEIDSLLAQRHLIDDAHHCPHGRPTALVLSRMELDRQFGRLG